PTEVRNLRVPAKHLARLRKSVTAMDTEERLALPGLDPRRADLVVAGAVLLDTLMGKLDAKEITLCDLALREGLVLDYIHRHRKDIARVDRYPDVRRRSAVELAERCHWEADHARQVARMAVAIFDQTRHLHGLGDREQEWLEYAALLHDIGNHISYQRHHRHSYYLIKNGDLRGFEPDEIEVIGLVARYHRHGRPKKEHEGYGDLSPGLRRTVRLLAAMLRVAETLDRSRHGVVGEVTVKDRGPDLRLQIEAVGDAELELWAGLRQLDVLAAELGRPIVLARVQRDVTARPRVRRTPARRALAGEGR
ncbi:MAG: HD domain-containing protein, partial [Acidobacteriota bacterium]|nr:HD domain-containing protein [Acidobacteriota bacterium]